MSISNKSNFYTNQKGAVIVPVLFLVIFVFIVAVFVSNEKSNSNIYTSTQTETKKELITKTKVVKKTKDQKKEELVNQSVVTENLNKAKKNKEILPRKKTPQAEVKSELISKPELLIQIEKPERTISFEEINQSVRKSLVNVLCVTKTGGSLNPISGSGVIIDDRGVILTNAHVAQYYLLENYLTEDFITCTIRMGSPSRSLYKAKIMYISNRWIRDNYENIVKDNYSESGEDDYALLLITEPVFENTVLPNKFDFVKIAEGNVDIKVGDNVIIAGYPAGFLGGITIQKNLYMTTTIEQINEVFTFKENTLDLISLGGSILAQKGSSGGAIVNNKGELIAIPVTSTNTKKTDERDLRAITASHINRSLKEEMGKDINGMLFNDPKTTVELFYVNKFDELRSFLVKALRK